MPSNKYALKKIMCPLKTNDSIKNETNDCRNKMGTVVCWFFIFVGAAMKRWRYMWTIIPQARHFQLGVPKGQRKVMSSLKRIINGMHNNLFVELSILMGLKKY